MKDNTSNIWIGGKDLTNDPEFIEISQKEFAEPTNLAEDLGNEEVAASMGGNRRDFLKFLGFGLGAATVAAGCDIPVKRAIPYVVKPDSIVPGVASYYSSTYVSGGESLPILVKTREGRPIKIEGNIYSSITHGGTSARAQAFVLSLYDTTRFATPKMKVSGEWTSSNWADVDKAVSVALDSAKGVRVVTNTVLSPTAQSAMSEFTDKFDGTIVTYDPVSSSAILDANEQSFGDRVIPDYRFDKADVIVSFGADFLGTWISPVEYAAQWVKGRKIKDIRNPTMSRHIQVESGMSMTGSNADNRIMVRPSEMGAAIAYLANKIVGGVSSPALNTEAKAALDKIATELTAARGKSLIVSGSNNVSEQILINAMNNTLGNLGTTVNFGHASLQRQGSEKELAVLISDINSGVVDVVIFNQCNPTYDFVGADALKTALAKVKTKISFATSNDETTDMCDIIAPTSHSLESWGDVEAKRGQFSIIQPTISNLFDTRQYEQSLLSWAGSSNLDIKAEQPYFDYLKAYWKKTAFASQSKFATFQPFWDSVLQDGVYEVGNSSSIPSFTGNISSAAAGISKPSTSKVEVSFFESISQGNGQFANNPWLQEMPDPVTRTSWGNYLAVPVNFDGVRTFVGYNDLVDGDLVDVTIGSKTVRVPVVQQFGQMAGTVSLALGYGREFGIKGDLVGVNVNDVLLLEKMEIQITTIQVHPLLIR
jgi:MoCo/4Fe-4S cofactor protein with predicted Tat translocation signal